MSIVGKVLLWVGFLYGSLVTVFQVEVEDAPWTTINWMSYAIAATVAMVGIVLIRVAKASSGVSSEKSQANLKEIKVSLDRLIVGSENLNQKIGNMSPKQMLEFIDSELTDDFRIFADGRDSITAEHGLDVFAEVMTQFSAGERAINRAWCAAADRYVDEAAKCVERAVSFLHETKRELDSATA